MSAEDFDPMPSYILHSALIGATNSVLQDLHFPHLQAIVFLLFVFTREGNAPLNGDVVNYTLLSAALQPPAPEEAADARGIAASRRRIMV